MDCGEDFFFVAWVGSFSKVDKFMEEVYEGYEGCVVYVGRECSWNFIFP